MTVTYRGLYKNGVIVLQDKVSLADGTPVTVRTRKSPSRSKRPKNSNGDTLGQRLLKHAGSIKGLPRDLARNHDHYIRGAAKR